MNNLKRYTLYILNAVDLLSCFLAFQVSFFVRSSIFKDFAGGRSDYGTFLLVVIVAYFLVNFFILYKDDRYLHRSSLRELMASAKMAVFLMALVVLYFNFTKTSILYSRLFEIIYLVSLILIDFAMRVIAKKLLISRKALNFGAERVLLIGNAAEVTNTLKKMKESLDWRYTVEMIRITGEAYPDKTLEEIPVVRKEEDLYAKDVLDKIDGIVILPKEEEEDQIREWMNHFKSYGKSVHVEIPEYELSRSFTTLDKIGGTAVVTYRDVQPMSIRQQLFKRIIDILLSVPLLPVYFIVFLLVKLFTSLESPGPVLVKRIRVGKNNIPFTQFRFRTYRADAKKRNEEGKDPHTFIGKIIEALHLDGLPLVLNVLSGDMSLIGPKAPNLPKYLRMSVRERNLLSIRPGIIGFWTTEQDLSKALSDETEYLENWTIFKDIAILFYCILRYVGFHSLRVHGDTHTDEEYAFAAQISRHNERIVYDRSLYTLKENVLYGALKRLLDVIISLVSLIVFSPVFLILAILVIANDGGSPFYTHERIGKDGRKINVFKFRSMRMDAGNLEDLLTPEQLEQYRKEFKIDDDPRITKIGEFIRRSSLDELPQLLNILTGEMSFVGPRPIVESELYEHYTEEEIAKILSVRPGLTGYWQAYARNNAEYETHERQDMELYYVDHRSFFFDVKIFFRTFYAVFKNDGAQ